VLVTPGIIEPGAPIPVAQRIWLDQKGIADYQYFRAVLEEAYHSPEAAKLRPIDKLEQVEPPAEYRPERGILNEEVEKTLMEEAEQRDRDRKVQEVALEYIRDHYVGGIGLNFDQLA